MILVLMRALSPLTLKDLGDESADSALHALRNMVSGDVPHTLRLGSSACLMSFLSLPLPAVYAATCKEPDRVQQRICLHFKCHGEFMNLEYALCVRELSNSVLPR